VNARSVRPYGSWNSPVTAAEVAAAGIRLGQVQVSGSSVYWLEGRPLEGGRGVIMRRHSDGKVEEVTGPEHNVRTRVHEYGGGDFLVHGETVFFSNDADQRLYRLDPGAAPQAITPAPEFSRALRYADGQCTPDGRWILCVQERHRTDGSVLNELVAIPTDGSAPPQVVASGRDFYAFPRLSPDGRQLTWTCWDAPDMPWDATELWVAEMRSDACLGELRRIAGGAGESVVQPAWSPEGMLHFISDSSGWWNLYCERDGEIVALAPAEHDFGVAQWNFGLSLYAFLADGRIACLYFEKGRQRLGMLEPSAGAVRPLELPWTSYTPAQLRAVEGGALVFIAAGVREAPAVRLHDADAGHHLVLRAGSTRAVDEDLISEPQAIEFPGGGGDRAHAFYYPPHNPRFAAPADELPPLLVLSHGGPTSISPAELSLRVQYWTTRGFAVVDVNYGGSTGYGRAYRERLYGKWGVVDTEDCIQAAKYLVQRGLADPRRLAIRGGSAGGYTTLCALVFHDIFRAGASSYGVADLETLVADTHKFEAHYPERLLGPYPERRDLYRERSPIHHAERVSCPVILFQGLEDAIVPPSQAEAFVHALQAKGVPHAYLTFAGEQHGFRKAETIQRCVEAELYFYAQVFGLEPADALEPVPIANL
jgi:dipeptidyl aminopeptidase/acylaminoacyl peptidase